jgi:hypothetical protein
MSPEPRTKEQLITDKLIEQRNGNPPEQATVFDIKESYKTNDVPEQSPMEKVINQENEILYDADAVQKNKFGGVFNDLQVTATFQPETDERFIEFDRKSATKYTDGGTSADLSGNADALAALFNDLVSDVEGFPGEKPQNWKDELDDDQHKIPMIRDFVAVSCYAAPFQWGQTTSAIISERYFNGEIAECRHYLRKKTVDDVKNYRKLQKIPLNGKSKGLNAGDIILPGYAEKKGQIYDKMQLKPAEGYAGRTPLRDKVAVIDYLFSAGVTKK